MADNYLENKYEEYALRKAAWEQKKKQAIRNNIAHNTEREINKVNNKKRAFVTGGAKGIGKSIVQTLCAQGWMVAFCDINIAEGEAVAISTGAKFYYADVSNATDIHTCMNQIFTYWGDIDLLINNAGVSIFTPITETNINEFDKIISINLRHVFITSRELAIHREKNGNKSYGRIINICSTRYLMSEEGNEAYAASKGGIYSLTHALMMSMSKYNITVNSISPGWIENGNYEALTKTDHTQHPSNRVGKAIDIANTCLFIAQEENNFINGENIIIDGGMTKKMIYL